MFLKEAGGSPIPQDYDKALDLVKQYLGHGKSFDVIIKEIVFGRRRRRAFLAAIDGFVKDQALLLTVHRLLENRDARGLDAPDELVKDRIGYIETATEKVLEKALDQVLAGNIALFVEGENEAVLIDARTYPARQPSEPDLEKVLRGPKDGFTETLVFNTALIRRRIRDPRLRVELFSVGERSRTDIALMYIDDIAKPELVDMIRRRIGNIVVDGLPMAEKSLEEFLASAKSWWNPFPVTRFSERPDTAAVHLLEGHVVIVVDTTPVVLILPTTFFHHMEHAEEFHQDPVIGAGMRFVRYSGLFLAWMGIPLWVALALDPSVLPEWLRFIGPKESANIPLFLQFILGEIGIELIRIALIHTPTALATSLGLIGAVVLGQLAVEVGLMTNEAILYVTMGALGAFSIPSMELSQAVRLMRIFLLVIAGAAKLPGVLLGIALNFTFLAFTRSYGVPYLWPLLPFDWEGMKHVIVRKPIPTMIDRPKLLDPQDKKRR